MAMKLKLIPGAVAVITLLTAAAAALPKTGDTIASARAVSADGATFDTRQLGKTLLLFYEDKDSSQMNQGLKDALTQLRRSEGYKPNVAIVAIADVRDYDYWPARGFVKDAIRSEEQRAGRPIYLDWNGAFGDSLGCQPKRSNVILVGANGKVVLAHHGIVPTAVRERILSELRR